MTFTHGIKKGNNNNKHNIIYLVIFSQNNSYGSVIGSPKWRERKRQMVGMRKKMELGRKEERVKYEGMKSCKAFHCHFMRFPMLLPFVQKLFVSVIDVVILQLFVLLKAPTMTCFKGGFY